MTECGRSHVACGSAHTVVVTQGGAVWRCDPDGPAHTLSSRSFARVAFLLRRYPRCATERHGGDSWGWGSFGQLGHGHALDVSTPAKVVALEGVMVCVVACGSAHTAVASDDGRMYTWVS